MVEVPCSYCGKTLLKTEAQVAKYKRYYCDNTCYRTATKVEKVSLVCPVCSNIYEVYPAEVGRNKTCSRKCYLTTQSECQKVVLTCLTCGIEFERAASLFKGKKSYCSRRCFAESKKVAVKTKPVYKSFRAIEGYRRWRLDVFERDNYTCVKCGAHGELHAHHILAYARFPESRVDVDNGASLCSRCHNEFHDAYTTRYFTDKDFYEYIKDGGFRDE